MALTIVGPVSVSPLAPGGNRYAVAISAPGVVKPASGILNKIVCIAAGTITVNDAATTESAASGNLIFPAALSLTAGQVVPLDWPCATGITVSAVTGTFNLAFT